MKYILHIGGFAIAAWGAWEADPVRYAAVMLGLVLTNLAGVWR